MMAQRVSVGTIPVLTHSGMVAIPAGFYNQRTGSSFNSSFIFFTPDPDLMGV
jgi:hypothetical protein